MYSYSVNNDTLVGAVDLEQLMNEISVYTVDKITIKGDSLSIYTNQTKTDIDAIVSAHAPSPIPQFKVIVKQAIDFFNDELIRFSAENITMGITQLNKTKEVADYLQNVMRYGQSGSLYEVVNEVNTLIANGIPFDLAPFVTEPRLNVLKANVLEYLS
jgi:hypothetical protein